MFQSPPTEPSVCSENGNNDNALYRAKREAELMERGTPASEAALRADTELTEKEESQQQELTGRLAAEK